MNPDDMSLEALEAEIRKEMGLVTARNFKTERSFAPVEVKAPRRSNGVPEDVAWGVVAVVTAALVILFIGWML